MGSVYRDISRCHSSCPFPWHQGRAWPGRAGLGHHFHHEGRGQSESTRDTAHPPSRPLQAGMTQSLKMDLGMMRSKSAASATRCAAQTHSPASREAVSAGAGLAAGTSPKLSSLTNLTWALIC